MLGGRQARKRFINTVYVGRFPLSIEPVAQPPLTGHRGPVRALAFSPDSRSLASASRDRTARLWPLSAPGEARVLAGHRGPVNDVAFSPDGEHLATASGDMQVKVWTADGREAFTLADQQGAVTAATFAQDGAHLACGWNMWSYGHVTLWDTGSREPVDLLRMAHGQLVFGLDFAPDGTLAIALAAGYIRLWKGGEQATIRGHGEAVRAVGFSPDGERLASGSSDRTIKVWALIDQTPQATLKGHTGAVHALDWSPDGALIASAGDEGTIVLWDAARGESVLTLTGLPRPLHAIRWSPDGATLAAGTGDGSILLWRISRS
jgi:WD40 repeat protein